MRILGYIQVQNEDRFAVSALESISDVVDDMLIVFDRCIDKTQEVLKTFTHSFETHITSTEAELVAIRKSLFSDFRQFDWILMLNGDEVYAPSIKSLRKFLSTKLLDDVSEVIGHTIHILNEEATYYTGSEAARSVISTVKLFNNHAIESIKTVSPWGLYNIKYTYGSRIAFDARQSTNLGDCLTVYHMHFLRRSSVEFKRSASPLSEAYRLGAYMHDKPLILPFLNGGQIET